jgi:predicted dehydrogenase
VGAGNRGQLAYGAYALRHPEAVRFVAVAEPDEGRRQRFASSHGIPPDRQFRSWEELAERPQLTPALINATQDRTHCHSALALLAAGYDMLLEKPIAATAADCVAVAQAAEQHGRILQIGHVLRYAPFFRRIFDLVTSGRLGEIVSVDWRENLVYWHYAHSFVRGNWSNSQRAGPMILTKCCHDLDLLVWMFGPCQRVASFGSLSHFRPERVGPEVPARCTDGCPVAEACPYYAPRLYLARFAENPDGFTVNAVTSERTPAGIMRALESGPYGRCVYRCDNDVVDHQVVLLELASGLSINLTMQGASHVEGRTVRIDGRRATLLANESRHEIAVHDHLSSEETVIHTARAAGGHSGGDEGLMGAFVAAVRGGPHSDGALTSARESMASHVLAFAAEQARVTGTPVDVADFTRGIAAAPTGGGST